MKKNKKLIWTSLLTAFGASLCCITPILALLSGVSGAASTFSWMEPFRQYLIGITVIVLSYAWYQQLKPKPAMDCNCEEGEKKTFMQTKLFLGIVTVVALTMLSFPYYSTVFYPENKRVATDGETRKIELQITGMTCESCAGHITYSVEQLPGIVAMQTSYEQGRSVIEYAPSLTNKNEITQAINSTGYRVIK